MGAAWAATATPAHASPYPLYALLPPLLPPHLTLSIPPPLHARTIDHALDRRPATIGCPMI